MLSALNTESIVFRSFNCESVGESCIQQRQYMNNGNQQPATRMRNHFMNNNLREAANIFHKCIRRANQFQVIVVGCCEMWNAPAELSCIFHQPQNCFRMIFSFLLNLRIFFKHQTDSFAIFGWRNRNVLGISCNHPYQFVWAIVR